MVFRVESQDDGMRHSVRTEVTVHEREQTLVLEGASWGGPKTCPLCGNPMFPVAEPSSEEKAQELKLGHRDGQGSCPGPKQRGEVKSSRKSENIRRLR